MSFVERHGLWSAEQKEAASRLARIVEERGLEVVRLAWPDQHGILRGKTLIAALVQTLFGLCTASLKDKGAP